jgi:translation elongation factor EF-Ts
MDPENLEELLNQEFIKSPDKTIKNLIEEAIQKFGEKTEIGRFVRFSIK